MSGDLLNAFRVVRVDLSVGWWDRLPAGEQLEEEVGGAAPPVRSGPGRPC